MQSNSTTILCTVNNNIVNLKQNMSQANSTQVITLVRASSKSQLWIPYVLIGLGCVAFLAVHFWCYHKRNRERYLRKREEIRVKCGLLERRRIATLMMARNRSQQLDTGDNTKKRDEEHALLGNPFYRQDDCYFHSRPGENSYYETLLEGVKTIDNTKPRIGCCLTCSASMPTGLRQPLMGQEKRRDFIHQSKSFNDTNLGNMHRSDLLLKPQETCMETPTHQDIPVRFHCGSNDFQPGYNFYESSSQSSSRPFVNYEIERHHSQTDIRSDYSLISGQSGWDLSANVNFVPPVENNVIANFEQNFFQKLEIGTNQVLPRRYYIPDERTGSKTTHENDPRQNNGAPDNANITPYFSNQEVDNSTSQGHSTSYYKSGLPSSNPEMNNKMLGDFKPDMNARLNIVSDDDDVDNRFSEGSNGSSLCPISTSSVDIEQTKQPILKTPALRSLNPSLVFENLHFNAK